MPGRVSELLATDSPESYELADMQATPAESPKTRAADLTDDELFIEVMHRLREWRNDSAVGSKVPSQADLRLAADANPEEKGDEGAPEESL
jgi:hypothetical protein